LGEGRISLVAVDGDDAIDWIGAIPSYDNAWELHPLVVATGRHGEGIGRALVEELEERGAGLGGATIYLGTDDQDGSTTVSGLDL
jgi:aminoglycoside 6'-N-acetyltransferase I